MLASATVRRARRHGDAVAWAVAEQAWGQALRHRGALDRALAHLQRGVRCAEEAGAAPTAAAARLALAFLLAERGRAGQALDELDLVLARWTTRRPRPGPGPARRCPARPRPARRGP